MSPINLMSHKNRSVVETGLDIVVRRRTIRSWIGYMTVMVRVGFGGCYVIPISESSYRLIVVHRQEEDKWVFTSQVARDSRWMERRWLEGLDRFD